MPFDWAMTQNNLGVALWTLGQREGGTARLKEAVVAYRAALEEWTRERLPLQWALTQNNLGNALQTLGQREGGRARLEEAVAAYRAALEERTRARVPLIRARAQNNLGNALWALGQRETGTARLKEAIKAWDLCLMVANPHGQRQGCRKMRNRRAKAQAARSPADIPIGSLANIPGNISKFPTNFQSASKPAGLAVEVLPAVNWRSSGWRV